MISCTPLVPDLPRYGERAHEHHICTGMKGE